MITSDELVARIANTLRELKGKDLELVAIEIAIQTVLAQMTTILRVDDIANDEVVKNQFDSFVMRVKHDYQRGIFGKTCIAEINELRLLKEQLETLKLKYNGDSVTQ